MELGWFRRRGDAAWSSEVKVVQPWRNWHDRDEMVNEEAAWFSDAAFLRLKERYETQHAQSRRGATQMLRKFNRQDARVIS